MNINTEDLDHLRRCLDRVCEEIAEKFGLYDSAGRARKAYILNVLTRHACPCCAVTALIQTPEKTDVDAIFRENHDLAVNLLANTLRGAILDQDLEVYGEAYGEYGRPDILITRLNNSLLLVRSRNREVIVEVKTNLSFGIKQVLRYLLERLEAVAVIWRVRKQQILVIDAQKHRQLLLAFTRSALHQAFTILNGNISSCNHSLGENKPFKVQNPQQLLDDFLTGLVEGLPKVVNTILKILKPSQGGCS